VTNSNVNEIPTERLKDYASTVKDVLIGERDGDGYDTAAEAQEAHNSYLHRHNELKEELNRRKEVRECPSNESISSLGSLRDHKFSEENFRDRNKEPVHYTETEENDPGSFSSQPGSSNNKRRLSSEEEMDEPNSKRVKTEKNEGPSSEGSSGQGSSNQGTSNTGGNPSPLDYVLDKQSGEMPDIFESDGGD
jgi:hypothetical protein